MNKTYGELVSRISNTLNLKTKDVYIPRRYILSVFKSKAELIISQAYRNMNMFRELGILKWIRCVRLEPIDSIKCGKMEFERCEKLMRTKYKLPKLIWSKLGASLFRVASIDGRQEFSIIGELEYSNIRNKRGFDRFKGKYAILSSDGYLYIPDSNLTIVDILVFTMDEKYMDMSMCDEIDPNDECKSYWDMNYLLPDRYEDSIITETLKEISMRLQIPTDNNPNLDDSQRTATIQ